MGPPLDSPQDLHEDAPCGPDAAGPEHALGAASGCARQADAALRSAPGMRMRHLFVMLVLLALPSASPLLAATSENATVPGELIVQEPTLICLGFEWRIAGDAN